MSETDSGKWAPMRSSCDWGGAPAALSMHAVSHVSRHASRNSKDSPRVQRSAIREKAVSATANSNYGFLGWTGPAAAASSAAAAAGGGQELVATYSATSRAMCGQ